MNNNSRVMRGVSIVSLLAIAALLACASPAAAEVYNFSFLPEQSSVHLSGGFGGWNETHSIEGYFQMTVDYEALTASFDQVNASLSPGGVFLSEYDLGTLFYMTELFGTVSIPPPCEGAPWLINFQGQSHDFGIPTDYIDCSLGADGSLELSGSFHDGYPDGFQYDLNALTRPRLELSVATDKPSYVPGEDITVSVTVYNTKDHDVTLGFYDSLQASYIMDDVYDWSSEGIFTPSFTEVTIGPESSHTWNLDHSWEEYDLSLGTHSVVGALKPIICCGGYVYNSQPVEFEVDFEVWIQAGDFDGDGDVDGVDFGIWQSEYPITSGPPYASDADGDGDVDGVDFGIWQANYPTNLGGGTVVPEPATLGVLAMGSGLALLKRRK